MILIAFIAQLIVFFLLNKNKAIYILCTGIVLGLINFLDLFSEIHYLKLSVSSTVVYLVIHLTYLAQELRGKVTNYRSILYFSFILATMDIYVISLSLIAVLVINLNTEISKKNKSLMLGLNMLALGNLLFLDFVIDPFYILVVLSIIGIKLARFYTPTNYSYFILTSYVTLKPFDENGLYFLISAFVCLFVIREMLLLNKEKIIKNNIIDKLTFSILIAGSDKNEDFEPTTSFSSQNEKQRDVLSFDITNGENQIDTLLVLLTIGTLIYLGVQYGGL